MTPPFGDRLIGKSAGFEPVSYLGSNPSPRAMILRSHIPHDFTPLFLYGHELNQTEYLVYLVEVNEVGTPDGWELPSHWQVCYEG